MTRDELTRWWNHIREAQEAIATAERAMLNARLIHGSYDWALETRARDVLGCVSGARELLALIVGRLEHLARQASWPSPGETTKERT